MAGIWRTAWSLYFPDFSFSRRYKSTPGGPWQRMVTGFSRGTRELGWAWREGLGSGPGREAEGSGGQPPNSTLLLSPHSPTALSLSDPRGGIPTHNSELVSPAPDTALRTKEKDQMLEPCVNSHFLHAGHGNKTFVCLAFFCHNCFLKDTHAHN